MPKYKMRWNRIKKSEKPFSMSTHKVYAKQPEQIYTKGIF